MKLTPVVTVFLTHSGRVMLGRRSARVGTYKGAWAGISGYIERLPLEQAFVEIREETGLSKSDIELGGIGIPIVVEDSNLNARWLVHPFLFEVTDPARIQTDWEVEEIRWVEPAELQSLPTVPGLDRALSSVWPPFGDNDFWTRLITAATDTTHGATTLALTALNALIDFKRRCSTSEFEQAIKALAACRPSMGIFPHLAARLLLGDTSVETLALELNSAVSESASRAAEAIADYRSILTLSYSSAVKKALIMRAASDTPLNVTIAESRPGLEGVKLAEELASEGINVTLITDAEIGLFVEDSDCVLVGCDAVTEDDMIQNKAGTSLAVLAAWSAGVACFAVTQTHKIAPPGFPLAMEEQDPKAIGQVAGVKCRNLVFDRTPISDFDAVYTESGALNPDQLNAIRSLLSTAQLST